MHTITKIRRSGGSVVTAVPPEFLDIFGLAPGDTMHWEIEKGRVSIEFYKAVKIETPALESQQEAAQ